MVCVVIISKNIEHLDAMKGMNFYGLVRKQCIWNKDFVFSCVCIVTFSRIGKAQSGVWSKRGE